MGWGHFVHSAKKALTNPKNIGAVVAAPFTAGASLLAMEDNSGRNLIDGLRGQSDVERQNQFNAQQAELNRQFQLEASNTAHQRQINDLIASGLNPVLSAGGQGATTPTGSMAQSVGLPQSPISALSEATSAAGNLMNSVADVNLKSSQAGLNKTTQENLEEQTRWMPRLNQAKINLDNATTGLQRQQIIESEAKTMAIDFNNKMAQMDVDKRSGQFDKELTQYKEHMTQALVDAGYDNSTIGVFMRALGKGVHQLSPFSEFQSHSNTYNKNIYK